MKQFSGRQCSCLWGGRWGGNRCTLEKRTFPTWWDGQFSWCVMYPCVEYYLLLIDYSLTIYDYLFRVIDAIWYYMCDLLFSGGRIDHAHHASNAFKSLTDTVAFAEAVEKAVNATSEADTLIVTSADHSHVFTIGGYPSRGNPILGQNFFLRVYRYILGLILFPYFLDMYKPRVCLRSWTKYGFLFVTSITCLSIDSCAMLRSISTLITTEMKHCLRTLYVYVWCTEMTQIHAQLNINSDFLTVILN